MLFRAEDTSRANYRSLFEYAVGDEARLAQDRRLAYYEHVLPEMLARVKGLPLMYQTYSKRWSPEDNRPQFIVKRLVPNDAGDKIDIVMESDQDIADFMARKGRFKGQHGFNKGFSYLAPIYHVQRDEMPFIQVDLDIDQADFGKQAWSRLLEAVEQVYNWFRENGYDPLINFTGSSFHVWAKDGQIRTYAETKEVLQELSQATDLPLAAGAAHVAGQITIDYPQNKYRAPLRFPLSIHGDTGLVSIIIPRNQLRRFDPLKRAHPEEVLKRLPKELERIDAWFSDLSTTRTKQAEETFSAESRKMKELKNRIRIQLAKLDEPLPDSANRGTPRRLFYKSVRDSYGKTRYVPSIQQIGLATRQVEREMSAETQSSAKDIIQRRLDELSDADKERCIWGDCGILADQLMKALQQAGHTDAVYEIGLAYIHPFEDYESKDFIGGHVVVTVDGESYDAYGTGAKERWVEGPVIQDILAESGFVELGPLLSAHLTVNWTTSTWDEIRESRSNLFSGQDVSAALDNWTLGKGAESSKTWYSSGNVHPWQLFLDTETLGTDDRGERDNYPYEDMKALESKYGLKPTSAVIWVSDVPEVAASYMIGQGIIHESDEEVGNWYDFSKSDLETTEFGQVYYPPHVDHVDEYQGTIMLETDDGDGGYLLSLNRDYTGQYGLKRIGMAAETEYKKKRQKPTPEPGVEGGTDLKPSRRKPPMKVKGSDVYSVQKHRATTRGSHRDIRIGLDGTLLSFVPVGRYEKKDDDGKWQKTDGSRLPKKIGEGVSVIRTEDHPFDYWWFEGEIPKDSYGAGPVSLETHGTRRIIEWKPDEKLKVEFIGGKYAGTYTFERSKKSKDGKVWWMRKSHPVPEDKTDKKTKKAEITDNRYGKLNFTRAFSNWNVTSNNRNYSPATRYIENLLEEAQYMQGKIILYRAITLANPEDFDPLETGESWTSNINFAEPYFGHGLRVGSARVEYEKYILTALVPVESIDWNESLARALEFGPPSDEKEIVLKRGAPIELINLPMELSFAIDATPEALVRASEEIERFVDESRKTWELQRPGGWVWVESEQARETFVKAFEEWSEQFLAGELPLVAGGWGIYHNRNQAEPLFKLDFERMISDARDLDYVPHLRVGDAELSTYVQDAMQYVENLLMNSQYAQGKLKLYRGIDLVNPEDFDPTGVGQSWTPVRAAAMSYFGHRKIHSRNLGFIYDNIDESEFNSYVLTALVPVDSIDWYTTVLRALAFSHLEDFDEKEIVLKSGAPIELIDVPFDLSFAIDGTPEVLIRAAEDEDWWFTMNTPLGPDEEFGPYDSHEEAMNGIERVMQKVISLQDGHTREFPRPYQGRRGSGFGLRAEDIYLTVGEAFDASLAEIRADVEAIQPRSKDLSEITLEDYEKTKQVYQRFMIPAGITGDIVRDEWYYETEPIYRWSDMFTLPAGAEEEWQQKIDAGKKETEQDILASDEINYAFYWYAVMQINSLYGRLLERIGERKQFVFPSGYAGPPVELPDIIESQRDETEVKIYRWLATSQDDEPVRRLRNRMRPVDVNYYGGYGDVDRISTGTAGGTVVSVRKGLEALSYGPCWSLSPDAYTRTDMWRLAQEDVVLKEREVRLSPFEKAWRMPTEEKIDVRTYVIEKSIPAADVDWYSTLISSALWNDSPEYEVIPKRGVFLSEEITDSSDFEQEFNKVTAEVTELFKEFSWWSDNQKELYDVSDLHDDAAGRARLRDVESHLARLTRPGSLLWSSGDDSAYDAYPDDLRNPTYVFEDSGIFVDEDGETDGYTDEERGETYEEGDYFTRPFEESPDLDIRLRYAYTLNRLSKLAEQYFSRLRSLRTTLKPQFASGEVTLYRAFSLPEGEVPQLRRMTIFPLSMRIGDARRMENREQRLKYNYESYGAHWSLLPGFEWSYDFPSHYGKPYIMEKQIPYTDVDWFTTLLVMAYGREPEWEVAVKENVFLAENEVKISLYHVTPLDQISNILETGLEPRIGPRSEGMELEPRVYLFGERESMQDSFIWEEMTDDRYGDEWLSGYAVLRIDLPADWFKQRRVLKTFHPDGAEPSWEWSTREAIPPEYIEVEEEWEWPEDDISRYFQADFGMPVYGKYLRDARNQAELDLATISDDYNYFHLSWDRFVIDKDGETFTFKPRVPTYPYGWESGSIEDDFTPRVSLSSSIIGCLDALPDDYDGTWYVYGTKQSKDIISVQDYFEACPEGYGRNFNLRNWINSLPQEDQYAIKDHSEHLDLELSGTGTWGINVSDLPPNYRDLFYACVPDALQHDEYWSLEPITMDYLGYITWDTISHWYEVGGPGYPAKILRNAMRNPDYWLSETIDEPHLYLDMDGCFADFAGAITERVNDVLQVQDVSEISSKGLRRAARKAKELGITSVTERDFDLSLSHDPIKKKVIDRMLYKIASEPDFFYNLEVINRDVLDEIIDSGRPFSFLSAPIGGTNDYSIEDKRAWVRDRLGLDVEVIVVPRQQKVDYCQPGDVLLDDHAGTIAEWREAGGVGIWFPHERI